MPGALARADAILSGAPLPDETEKEPEKAEEAQGILARADSVLSPALAPAPAPMEADNAARERVAAMKAAGDEQWQQIEESQEGDLNPLAEAMRKTRGELGERLVQGVGQVAGGAQGALQAGASGVEQYGQRLQRQGEERSEALGDRSLMEPVGRAVEEAGFELGRMVDRSRQPSSQQTEVEVTPHVSDEDFWKGMKEDPLRTLALQGTVQIPQLVATLGAAGAAGMAGGAGVGFLQEAGNAHNQAIEEGANEEQAVQAAGMTGLANMFLEYLPAGMALKRLAGPAKGEAVGLLKDVIKQAASEGLTESMQELNSILMASLTYAEDHEWSWDDVKQAGASGLLGAVVGGPVGAATSVASRQGDTLPSTDDRTTTEQETSDEQGIRQPQLPDREDVQDEPGQDAQPDEGRGIQAREQPQREPQRSEAGQQQQEVEPAVPPTAEAEASSPPPSTPPPAEATGPGEGGVVEGAPAEGEIQFVDDEGAMEHAGSAVSPEAISRQQGGTRFYEVSPSGDTVPMIGPEAVDQAPRRGYTKVRLSPNGEAVVEAGTLNRAQQEAVDRLTVSRETPQEATTAPELVQETPTQEPTPPAATQAQDEASSGTFANIAPEQLDLEPERFQFKLDRDAVGSTGSLAGISEWDSNLAGVVSVWRDSADNRLKVVNGHNRVAKARQLQVPGVRVMEIDAASAKEARAVGAMQNIAEGHGSPVDAAKFFRDSGMVEEEAVRRLPLSQATVDQGLGLAGLSDFLFGQVTRGDLAPQRGSIIGRHLSGKDDLQNQLYKEIAKREKRQRVTNEMVEDIARRMQSSGTVSEESAQAGLFGDVGGTERSLAFEEAELAADVRQRLRRQKRAFGNAARNAPMLSEAGNVIDQEMSRGVSEQAAVNLAVFEKLRNTTEIGGIISEAARDLATGKESSDAIKNRVFDRIREAVGTALGNRAETRPAGVSEAGESGSGAGRTAEVEQGGLFGGATEGRLETEGQEGSLAAAAGKADVGGYAPSRPSAQRPRSMPLNLPELVEVAQDLGGGRLPRVRKALRAARGKAVGTFLGPDGSPNEAKIELRADLPEDPEQAKRTLAHEIGHWIDYLPEASLKRGNILGSVASLKKYLKGHLDALPAEPSRLLTPKERARIRRAAKKAGEDPSEAIQREADARDLIGRGAVMEELIALSKQWKPYPENVSEKYRKYREHPRELYADALSVLLNDPALLEQEAPLFARSFFGHLNRKPEVARAYLDIQERIAEGEGKRLEVIEERVANMVQRGGIRRAQELLSRVENATAGEVVQSAAQALIDGMIDKNAPLQRRIRAARKSGKSLSAERNPMYWVEEMAYANSEAAAYLDRVQENVLYPLRSIGVTDADLGQLLFLRRAGGERAEIWNPLGIDAEVAPKLVKRLEEKWGDDTAALVKSSLERWWSLRQPLIEKLVSSGAVTEENAEKMRTNPEYARFTVQQFIDEAGAGAKGSALGALKEQIGTLQEIGNPLVETMLTDLALMRLAHRNTTARRIVEFMRSMAPDEIQEASRGPGGRIQETAEDGMATIRYLENGKSRGAHVPAEIASSLESHLQSNWAYNAWMRFAQNPIRTLFVERNPGWAAWNLARDTTAFWKQIIRGNPLTSSVKMLQYLAKAAPDAWNAVAGKNSELVREILENRAIVQPGERVYRAGEITEATAVNELLQHFHVFGAVQHENPTWQDKWTRFLDRFTPFSKKPGEFSERWTKIAGYMYLKDHQQEFGLTDKELAHQVRTRVGTPDVYRRGKWFRLYNSLLLFSNVNKEGWRAALETVKERPIEYSTKTLTQIVGLKAATWAWAYLLFGDDWEEWWEKVPEHDKRNYGIIPMGETKDGKAVYGRLPFDYTGQVVNAAIQIAFNERTVTEKKDDLGRLLVEGFPFSWAGFHPYLEVSLASGRYLGEGKNPYDSWSGRQVIKQRTFDADKYGKDALTEFSRWMWNQLGGRLIVQWDTEELDRKRGPMEGALQWPILGPFLGRIYKVSDYGLEEKAWRLLEEDRSEKAQISAARGRLILQALDADPDASVDDIDGAMERLGIAYESYSTLERRVEELRKRYASDDPLQRVATFAQSEELKEKVLALGKDDTTEEGNEE